MSLSTATRSTVLLFPDQVRRIGIADIAQVLVIAVIALLLVACDSEDAAQEHAADTSPAQSGSGNSKLAVATPSPQPQAVGQSPASVSDNVDADNQVEQPLPDEALEPRADEIARTIELETELSETVQAAASMLNPQQAQELLARADGWAQNGFGCPEDASREACRQFNIRHLIKEIDNQMRGFQTEY